MTPAARLRERAWAYTRDAEKLRALGNTADAVLYEAIATELRLVAEGEAPQVHDNCPTCTDGWIAGRRPNA